MQLSEHKQTLLHS